MKHLILTSLILASISLNANAMISAIYQRNPDTSNKLNNSDISKVQMITNDSIILNPSIDDIDVTDPRIKSIIDYTKANGKGVSIIFFNEENLRYVKKVNEMFKTNRIHTDPPQLAKTINLADYNLIKIYVIKENHNDK